MKLIKEVNIIEDKKMIWRLNLTSLGLWILFFALFEVLAYWIQGMNVTEMTIVELFIGSIALLGLLVIHELIHGLFFKLYQPEKKVEFGFKNGMAYATSSDSYYPRNQYIWIAAAPFVLITLLLLALFIAEALSKVLFVMLASIHAAGCVGDFYYLYLLSKQPKDIQVKDTEKGIELYR
ncbi:DUF3267 domain-containing protein [Atopococcus tabaci]|uniref:DUF3267 domain-containing protein n=1 Tax=Atopococcus tabaci TaxID=269774 RepID=UPI0003FAB818|nr:DUF3267 domain-containing protein [Atopococcus tabaci]